MNEKERFEVAGQGHVFAWWDQLDEQSRESLCEDARLIDLEEMQDLVVTLVKGEGVQGDSLEGLQPAPFVQHPQSGGDTDLWAEARNVGEAALKAGKVAAFTVAGGQGTRLGYDGPKGTFPVTPVSSE